MEAPLRAVEEMAIDNLSRGDAALAIADLSIALDESPDEGRLWELLGLGQWKFGAVQESIRSLETAMTLIPLGAKATLALALGYEVIQKFSLAKGLLVELATRNELPTTVFEALARGLGRANEPALALAVCQRAAAAHPDKLGPLMGIVFYMGRLGVSSERMLPPLFRALDIASKDFSIRMLTARCLHDCGLSEDAAEVLRVVSFLDSRCPNCLRVMQEVFHAAGDERTAAQVVERLGQVARELGAD